MNIRGITAVIMMVTSLSLAAIIGMIVVAVVKDGVATDTVLGYLQTVAVAGVSIAGLMVQHYITAGQQTTQASQPPTAMVPVTVTATQAQAPASSPAATGEVGNAGT